jgi:hypothetical protein
VKYECKNPPELSTYTLKNDGQEGKTGPVQSGYYWEGAGYKEKVCICMKIEE